MSELELNVRQQAMLKEMGIRLPWAQMVSDQGGRHADVTLPAHTHNAVGEAQTASSLAPAPEQAAQQIQAMKERVSELRGTKPGYVQRPVVAAKAQDKEAQTQEITSEHAQAISAQALEERAKRITSLSWLELEEAVNQCDACTLCKSRKNTVFGVGDIQANWMIVGEAPGEQEDKQGMPFVGPAGQLLDRMLEPLNISRTAKEGQLPLYICNVLKCRPPRNRNPDANEMALCEPFLKRQIELVQPKIILIVGRFAVQTLLKTHEAIGRLRGTVHTYNGIPAIVTYHPAYLLRNPVDKRKSWADLCLAAKTLEDNAASS